MLKTTIPTLEISTSDVDLSLIQTISIEISQTGYSVTKGNDDIEVDNNIISVSLTREEYNQLRNGNISTSITAVGYDGNSYDIKVTWVKFGSRTSYEGGSGGGGTEYEILPTVEAVEANTESGKLVDALAIKEVFTSVSSGKSLIASAITDKGVETDATATFQNMADNIRNITVSGGENGSPYLFKFYGSRIPFSASGSGDFTFPIMITKIKKFIIKKFQFDLKKGGTSNASGSFYFRIKGVNDAGTADMTIKQWSGSVATGSTSATIVNIYNTDTELDLTGFSKVTKIQIGKYSSSGASLEVNANITFEAELYF